MSAMPVSTAWKKHLLRGAVVSMFGFAAYAALASSPLPMPGRQEIPGPLSAAHVPKPGETECSSCHDEGGKVAAAKCLACHTEIASRIAAQKGYHRDKPGDCALCHASPHPGRQDKCLDCHTQESWMVEHREARN